MFTKALSLCLLISIVSYGYSQTTKHTITYSSSGLSTSDHCNIFNDQSAPAQVNGYAHYPVAGGATFDGTNIVLQTQYSLDPASNLGTAYAIKFPFKAANTYSIQIVAKGTDGSGTNTVFPYIFVSVFPSLPDPNQTYPTACGAVDENKWSVLQQNGLGGFYISQTSATYSVPDYVSTAASSQYIIILAYGGSSSPNKALISKVIISETPNAPDLVLTPTSISLTCGTTPAQTLTVTNPHNVANITSYEWDLGSTNNGWSYNGNLAPRNISTTTNSIVLTPSCGSPLSNISVTVKVNNVNYKTYTCTLTVSNPAMSISGSSQTCSGSYTYLINNLPCNSAVAWTAPPSNLGTLTTLTASPTTFIAGAQSGTFTLTANVTSCGIPQTVTLPIHQGPYSSSDYTLSWNAGTPPNYCTNETIVFTLSGGPTGANYNWTWPPGWTLLSNSTTSITLKSPPTTNPPTGSVAVTFTEPCGTGVSKSFFVAYNSNACTSANSPYSISPNPASSTITIYCTSLQTYCNIAQVQITNLYGTVLSSQSWTNTNQQVQMPVSFLQNGTYIAKIYSGTQWFSNQFIVQH